MPVSSFLLERQAEPAPFVYRLIYRSVSRCSTGAAGILLVGTMAKLARTRNARLDITGVLYHDSTSFMQVLEGPPDAVNAVFASIARDDRHERIDVVNRSMWPRRAFAGWSMALVSKDDLVMTLGRHAVPNPVVPTDFVASMRVVLEAA